MEHENLIPTLKGRGLIHLDINRVLAITAKGHVKPVAAASDLLDATDSTLIHILVRPYTLDGADPAERGATRSHHYLERDGWELHIVHRDHIGDPAELQHAAQHEKAQYQTGAITTGMQGESECSDDAIRLLPIPNSFDEDFRRTHRLAAWAYERNNLLLIQGIRPLEKTICTSDPETALHMGYGNRLDATVRVSTPDGTTQHLPVRHHPPAGQAETIPADARLKVGEPVSRRIAGMFKAGREADRRQKARRLETIRSGAHPAVATAGPIREDAARDGKITLLRNRPLTFMSANVRAQGDAQERMFKQQLSRIIEAHLSAIDLHTPADDQTARHIQKSQILDIADRYLEAFRAGLDEPDSSPLFRCPEPATLRPDHTS